jgi:hypothetical protein
MLRYILSLGLIALTSLAADSVTLPLSKELEPLQRLLGIWKGEFVGGKSEKPMVDAVRFERALNGKAVRILHSVNDGIYGGETLVIWNPQARRIETFYFTTAGYRTEGVMTVDKEGVITSTETLKADESKSGDPITQVRATTKMLPDGRMHVKSEYRKKAGWQAGHEIIYKEDSAAQIVFK